MRAPAFLIWLLTEVRRERAWRQIRTVRSVGDLGAQEGRSWGQSAQRQWGAQPTVRILSRGDYGF